MNASAEIQPKRAAPRTARACWQPVGHEGLDMVGISAAPNGIQFLGETDVRMRGAQISACCHPQLGTFRAPWTCTVVHVQQ